MIILAIDPGEESGWAWMAQGHLWVCGLGLSPQEPDVIVIEFPEHYQGSGIDPASLIKLAMNAGRRVQHATNGSNDIPVYGVLPKTWKKNLSKDVCQQQTEYILQGMGAVSLHAAARGVFGLSKSKAHNVWDAIALGLWAQKRAAILPSVTDYIFPVLK